jgi:Ca2+-binding EF-hand superfamily protein
MSEFTEQQIKECQDVFNFMDKDEDGKLSVKEVEYALGVLGRKMRIKEMQEISKKGKSFSFDDFLGICKDKVDMEKVTDSMVKAFKIFESEKPGLMKKNDLIFVLRLYNEKITDKDVNDIVKESNPDKDGYIDFNEFAKEMLLK